MNGTDHASDRPWLIVLGTAQDAGVPQAGCQKDCCVWARADSSRRRLPACLGIVDPRSRKRWIIDCTPSFPEQLALLDRHSDPSWGLAGIFLTHAHMGHYVGLLQLGREVMGVKNLPVHVMPRIQEFLTRDAPWRLLVEHGNIDLKPMKEQVSIQLADDLQMTPILVPHRDELSETVCFRIDGPEKSGLHLPDIDAWTDWNQSAEEIVCGVDVAWLDGTFYDLSEVSHRNADKIPHPTIQQSMAFFSTLKYSQRSKIRFTHLNHTNPICRKDSSARLKLEAAGFNVAGEGEVFSI